MNRSYRIKIKKKMDCTLTTQYAPPVVLGTLWLISEGLSYVPPDVIKANGILQLITGLLSKMFTKKVIDQDPLINKNIP